MSWSRKTKEELDADLRACERMRKNTNKYSLVGAKNRPFFHNIFPESNTLYKDEGEEGMFLSKFPDEWVPDDIQIVHAPTFSTLRELGSSKVSLYDGPSEIPDGVNMEYNVNAVIREVLLQRTYNFREPTMPEHRMFRSLVGYVISAVRDLATIRGSVHKVPVNVYLMSLFEIRQPNRLGYLRNEVDVGARMATFIVPPEEKEVPDGVL